ncbi:MAG: UbiA family prenyltransferase [bacterium]|nr:UbiA family prenyltransferase [bacterium]
MLQKQSKSTNFQFLQNSRYKDNDYFVFFRLIRIENCLIASAALLLGNTLADGIISVKVIHGMIAAFFLTAASNIHNDYLDYQVDKINRPERPLPKGKFSMKWTVLFSILFYSLGLCVTFFWEWKYTLFYLLLVVLSLWYNMVGKKIAIIGNITIAFFGALVPFMGAMIAENVAKGVFPALLVFIVFLAREIAKDMDDKEGDLFNSIKTIAFYLNDHQVQMILIGLNCIVVVVLTLKFFFYNSYFGIINSTLFFLIIGLFGFMIYQFYKYPKKKKTFWRFTANLYKLVLVVGILFLLSHYYQV